MKKRNLIIAAIAVASTAGSLLPATADPLAQRDMVKVAQQAPKRYLASEPGKTEQLTFLFGPYIIPPGQDSNRLSADIQLPPGMIRAISPELVDAASGRVPTEQEAHIHHAHWFRVTTEDDELYYTNLGGARTQAKSAINNFPEEVRAMIPDEVIDSIPAKSGLSWVFGTGEEKTQGGFAPREALDDVNNDGVPDVRYGMEIDPAERQVLIYMIHNKTAAPMEVFVTLDVDFMHGTAAEITEATGIEMRELKGALWGTTRSATRASPSLVSTYTAEVDSTAIVSGGHTHPGSYGVVVTNQGPGRKCTEDFDNDGYPGITLFNSRKIDHVPGSWPYSEDFQMGVTKYGWRAPVHAGDVLSQIAPHDIDNEVGGPKLTPKFALPGNYAYPELDEAGNTVRDLPLDTVDGRPHQTFQSMNHVGMYFDPKQPPQAYSAETDANGCPANFAHGYEDSNVVDASGVAEPYLLGADTPIVQQKLRTADDGITPYYAAGVKEGMQNHVWPAMDPTCGNFAHATRTTCEDGLGYNGTGVETDTIHIAGFQYLPGGYGLPGELGAPAIVKKGVPLQIVNEDVVANVRHTLTTCPWPCTGGYVANFPFQDGFIDTDKLGNIDPIEGSPVVPLYTLNTTNIPVGKYAYYCRIHPFMRGAFEIVA